MGILNSVILSSEAHAKLVFMYTTCLYLLASDRHIYIVYIVKKVGSFQSLGQLMDVARKRACSQATIYMLTTD